MSHAVTCAYILGFHLSVTIKINIFLILTTPPLPPKKLLYRNFHCNLYINAIIDDSLYVNVIHTHWHMGYVNWYVKFSDLVEVEYNVLLASTLKSGNYSCSEVLTVCCFGAGWQGGIPHEAYAASGLCSVVPWQQVHPLRLWWDEYTGMESQRLRETGCGKYLGRKKRQAWINSRRYTHSVYCILLYIGLR